MLDVELTIESDYVKGSTAAFLKAVATQHEELEELYETWLLEDAVYPFGALEFLRWLEQQTDEDGQPFVIDGPHWDMTVTTANTVNTESWLDEDFHYTLFQYEGTACVAISDAVAVGHATFYELTCDAMEDFFDWSKATIHCSRPEELGGPHVFSTQDLHSWYRYDPATGNTEGDAMRLHEVVGDGGACRECGTRLVAYSGA